MEIVAPGHSDDIARASYPAASVSASASSTEAAHARAGKRAIQAFRSSREIRTAGAAHHALGIAYESGGEYEGAIASYEKYLAGDPPNRYQLETHVRELKVLAKHGCTTEEKLGGWCKPSTKSP